MVQFWLFLLVSVGFAFSRFEMQAAAKIISEAPSRVRTLDSAPEKSLIGAQEHLRTVGLSWTFVPLFAPLFFWQPPLSPSNLPRRTNLRSKLELFLQIISSFLLA